MLKKWLWLNLYLEDSFTDWKFTDEIYFRHTPYPYDWLVLLMMCLINFINTIFYDEKFADQLSEICFKNLRDQYSDEIFALIRFRNSNSRFMIIPAMSFMFYFIGQVQTTVINWGFFVLNILNFAFIAKGDNKLSTNTHSRNIANMITVFSAFSLSWKHFSLLSLVAERKL